MTKYRATMAHFLCECHQMIQAWLSKADFKTDFPHVFGHPDENNREIAVRNECALLLRKAQMHIAAILKAHENNNLHSMAVQMRVTLECAAQVHSMAWAAHQGTEKALRRTLNAREYDFQYVLRSLSRGDIDHDEIHEMILRARAETGEWNEKPPKTVRIADTVDVLPFGKQWYDHLSKFFCRGEAGSLGGCSYFGGVVSIRTEADKLTFGIFIGYLTAQVIRMLVGYGFLLIAVNGDRRPFEEALDLSRRQRIAAASVPYADRPADASEESIFNGESVPMEPDRIGSHTAADRWVSTACEKNITHLRELMALHLAIDGPLRVASRSESESILRLRKAHFHIRAITTWSVSHDVLHVMAPDLRAANEQLIPMVVKHLYENSEPDNLVQQRKVFDPAKADLDHFTHPTPFMLIRPQHIGGLGDGPAILSLARLHLLLASLVVDFAAGLSVVTDRLGRPKHAEILEVIDRSSEEFASVSHDFFLRAASPNRS